MLDKWLESLHSNPPLAKRAPEVAVSHGGSASNTPDLDSPESGLSALTHDDLMSEKPASPRLESTSILSEETVGSSVASKLNEKSIIPSDSASSIVRRSPSIPSDSDTFSFPKLEAPSVNEAQMFNSNAISSVDIHANDFSDVPSEEQGSTSAWGLLNLSDLISQTRCCLYQPMEFFVAWQGVLTIAYTGIPPPIVKLKEKISARFDCLPKENPGSKWPKTSLACVKDGKRLSLAQLQILRNICSEESFPLIISNPLVMDNLSIVLYENACLEKIIMKQTFELQQPIDPSPPCAEERYNVSKVVNEFDRKNLDSYWFHASKDGNRSSHYRNSKLGSTIVHFLGDSIPFALLRFRDKVDNALPGIYDWFSDEYLHITIRGLS